MNFNAFSEPMQHLKVKIARLHTEDIRKRLKHITKVDIFRKKRPGHGN